MGQRIFRTLHQVKQEDIFVLISGVQLVFYEYLKDSILNLLAPGEDLSLLKFSPFPPPPQLFAACYLRLFECWKPSKCVFSRFLISPSISGSHAVGRAKTLYDALPVLHIWASFALYFVGAVYDNGLLFLPCGFIFWGGFSYSLRTVLVCFLPLNF